MLLSHLSAQYHYTAQWSPSKWKTIVSGKTYCKIWAVVASCLSILVLCWRDATIRIPHMTIFGNITGTDKCMYIFLHATQTVQLYIWPTVYMTGAVQIPRYLEFTHMTQLSLFCNYPIFHQQGMEFTQNGGREMKHEKRGAEIAKNHKTLSQLKGHIDFL